MTSYEYARYFDEDDEHDESEDSELEISLEGTHSKYDVWGACHSIFQALELAQDRIVPPEIIALLEEARDYLDRVLFYDCKAKYAKVGMKFPLSKAKWILKKTVCLF